MLGEQRVAGLLQRVLGYSGAEETEVVLVGEDSALTRFANSSIHQNVAEQDVTITVRAATGKRVGSASTNDLSDEALARVVGRALSHARQQPEDPHFPGFPEPRPVEPVAAFDEATSSFTPEARARGVGVICALANERGMQAAGAFSTTTSEVAIANSHDLHVYHCGTAARLQTVVTAADGSGRARASSIHVHALDAEAIGREAVATALRAQNPRPLAPGDYTVVVEPYVTEDLLNWLSFSGMGAEAVQEGRSWMNGRIGTQVMSPLISIWDDARDARGRPLPFDWEGMPRQRVAIVEQGVVVGPVYDRYTAHKEGRDTTGHAMPREAFFVSGPLPTNLALAAGSTAVEEMIRSTEKGLYITSFWYTRLVHPRDCVITGMTRDGVSLIENGELTGAVKNLCFTHSYVQALRDVQAVGREVKTLLDDWFLATRVPALKIEHFTFTGLTV